MRKNVFTLLAALFLLTANNSNAATVTVGATGTYSSIAAAITGLGTITEPTVIELTTDYAQTTDSIMAIAGASADNTVTIRPQGTLSVSGNGYYVWKMKGCQYVTIDGRVNGEGSGVLTLRGDTVTTGTIADRLKKTVTLYITEDASNNTIKYTTLLGATTVSTWKSGTSTANPDRGTITIGAGITTGNNNNTIDHCNLGPINAATGTPTVAVYSVGIAGVINTNTVISNNNIYDYYPTDFNKATTLPGSGVGVLLGSYTNACVISGNSFYQTLPRAKIYTPSTQEFWGNATGAKNGAIAITNTSGSGYIIKNNYIGGSEPMCGGSNYRVITGNNSSFNGIFMNVSPTLKSFVYGNTIKNLYLGGSLNQTAASQTALISFIGSVYVGIREDETTADGNILGDQSASTVADNASIRFSGSASNGSLSCIVNNSVAGATVKIANNKMGGIYIPVNPFTATWIHYLVGINNLSSNQCTVTAENNEFGNSDAGVAAESMSIQNRTGRPIYGVFMNAASTASTYTFQNNKFSNIYALTSTTADPGQAYGFFIPNNIGCPVTISNNEIHDIVYTNKRSGNTADAFTTSGGISFAGYGNGNVISGNKIYNIQGVGSNSYCTNGISVQCFNTSATARTDVYNNLIYNIAGDATSTLGTNISGTTGINLSCSGTAASAYSYVPTYNVYNNIVRLGYNRDGSAITLPIALIGIRDTMISNSTNAKANYYNNTVYIGGTGVASTVNNPSMGFCFATYNNNSTVGLIATSVTRVLKNNLVVNVRSNETTGGGHYAIGTGGTSTALANFTSDKNNYYVSGTGTVLGRFTTKTDAADVTAIGTYTAGDANSKTEVPYFSNATAATPNLHLIQNEIQNGDLNFAEVIALTALDYDGDTRKETNPTVGADEYKGPQTAFENTSNKNVYAFKSGNNLTVNNLIEGQQISVYNANGQLLFNNKVNGNQLTLNLRSGIYLIKTETQNLKVVM